jgi:hypothetical protein
MKAGLPTTRAFLVVLFLGLFAMAARNVIDPDVWWHLKTGQLIAQSKSVPHTDPFSYTRSGKLWVAHEWLSDLLLYEIERSSGMPGLILIFASVLCATFFPLYLRCGAGVYVAGLAALAAAWATRPVWGVRPQILSLLLTSLWLVILERSENNSKLLWWTLPLTLLWVNLHAGFALGLALSALFIAGHLLERALGYSRKNFSTLQTAAIVLFIDLLLVPANPNGLHMFWYPIETLRSQAMQSYIAEWASPNFHQAEYWPFLFLIVATFATLAWSRKRVRPRNVLLLVVSLYAGLASIRMIPLFVLIAVPLIASRIGHWPKTNSSRQQSGSRTLANCIIVVALAAFSAIHIADVIRAQPQAEREHFPVQATEFLRAHSPRGRLFNHYDWGGYLIWKLYPSTRVFVDGRADLYGEQLLHEFADTYQFKDGWGKTLQEWGIQTVLVPHDSALATGLRNAEGWRVAYEDAQAMVLTAQPTAAAAENKQASHAFPKRSP